jgi:hypothetical protein
MSQRKLGEGSLRAFLRQGHKEIGQALEAFNNGIRVVEEPGAFNNPTSYEVSKQTGAVQTKQESATAQIDQIDKNTPLRDQLQPLDRAVDFQPPIEPLYENEASFEPEMD